MEPVNATPRVIDSRQPWSVILGLTCLWLWCFVLVPKDWRPRLGWRTAWKVLLTQMTAEPKAKVMLWTARLGSLGIIAAWWFGETHWRGLLSSLVGLVVGGGLIWYIRVIGGMCLKHEAMGFGIVTLMAMLGAFLGWQACVAIYFIAPLLGLPLGICLLAVRGSGEFEYGPCVCVAAFTILVSWAPTWQFMQPVFAMGWQSLLILLLCLAIFPPLLLLQRMLRRLLEA